MAHGVLARLRMSRAKITSRLFTSTAQFEALPTPAVIPFDDARLCLDCEIICAGRICPKCAGRSLHPIASWLKSRPQAIVRAERRRIDRRHAADPNYRGPERRKSDRRSAAARNGHSHSHSRSRR